MNAQFLMALALASLGGCAATYREPALPTDHPANPAVEVASLPEQPRALAVPAEAQPSGTPPPMAPASAGATHDAHGAATAGASAAAMYVCPMHPEVTSDQPGQRCPKCGMKLVKKEGGKQP